MSMRISSALLPCLLLAACGAEQSAHDPLNIAESEAAAASGKVMCATDGATVLQQACTLERISSPEGAIIIVRHPGGGFRRFSVVTDGRGVVPADGAETATVKLAGSGSIEVTVAGDRYQLPARLSPRKPATP